MPDLTLSQHSDAVARVRTLERLDPDGHRALAESGLKDVYLRQLARLDVMLSIGLQSDQLRAICLRLATHGATEEDARWVVDHLIDSPEFGDKVTRFRGSVVPADFVGPLLDRPRPGDEFTDREMRAAVRRFRLDPEHFLTTTTSEYGAVLVYQPEA